MAYLYSGMLLLLFSHQVASNSLRLHGLQHATLTAGGLCGLEGHLKPQHTQTCFPRPSQDSPRAPATAPEHRMLASGQNPNTHKFQALYVSHQHSRPNATALAHPKLPLRLRPSWVP